MVRHRFFSPNGLIATNHHVAAGYIERLSSKERDLLKTGFYARTPAEELKIPDANASVLQSFEDVTARIRNAEKSGTNDVDAAAKRTAEIANIEKECSSSTGLRCEVISFYSGGEYWLYRFKRYDDIRLVMAPEEQAAFLAAITTTLHIQGTIWISLSFVRTRMGSRRKHRTISSGQRPEQRRAILSLSQVTQVRPRDC
jgi:hypothetical protein